MPIYVYEVIGQGEQPGEQFEVFQKLTDPPLAQHPQTGQPVRRVLTASAVGGKWSDAAMHRRMSDNKHLDRLGFTKYVKSGDGTYEKTVGQGPDMLNRGTSSE